LDPSGRRCRRPLRRPAQAFRTNAWTTCGPGAGSQFSPRGSVARSSRVAKSGSSRSILMFVATQAGPSQPAGVRPPLIVSGDEEVVDDLRQALRVLRCLSLKQLLNVMRNWHDPGTCLPIVARAPDSSPRQKVAKSLERSDPRALPSFEARTAVGHPCTSGAASARIRGEQPDARPCPTPVHGSPQSPASEETGNQPRATFLRDHPDGAGPSRRRNVGNLEPSRAPVRSVRCSANSWPKKSVATARGSSVSRSFNRANF
jgi:hypothetical protein